MAMIKVCDELDLHFGRCKSDARTILKKGQREPTAEHLKKAMDEIEEEHRAILFLYKADRQRYIKMIEQMENEILQTKRSNSKISRWRMQNPSTINF